MYEPFLRAQLDHSESVTDSDEEVMLDVALVPQWIPRVGQDLLSALMEACLNIPSDGCECWAVYN